MPFKIGNIPANKGKKGSPNVNKGKKWKDFISPDGQKKAAAARKLFQKGNIPFIKGKKWENLYSADQIKEKKKKIADINAARGAKEGDVRIFFKNKKNHFKFIRLENGWRGLHLVNWEKEFGPFPKNHVLIFIDGDTLNPEVDNLRLVSKSDYVKKSTGAEELTDGYVATMICKHGYRDIKEDVLQNKSMIELKRQQLILKRTINGR